MLPKPSKVKRVKHHAALPWRDVPAFMADLAKVEGVAARALALTILTAVRTGEAIGARWSEIAGDVWIIPAERTKTGKQHRVPLSAQALAILDAVKAAATVRTGFVFPGDIEDWPITNMAMLMCLRRLKGKCRRRCTDSGRASGTGARIPACRASLPRPALRTWPAASRGPTTAPT